jgi:hypothetical protein
VGETSVRLHPDIYAGMGRPARVAFFADAGDIIILPADDYSVVVYRAKPQHGESVRIRFSRHGFPGLLIREGRYLPVSDTRLHPKGIRLRGASRLPHARMVHLTHTDLRGDRRGARFEDPLPFRLMQSGPRPSRSASRQRRLATAPCCGTASSPQS